jgi:hypothetical protein
MGDEAAVGRRIRERLLARGYRRDDGEPDVRNFAFDYRFDKGHVYAWMSNKMKPFKNIVELCHALDCSIDWLLTGKERDPKAQPGKARQHNKVRSLLLALAVGVGLLSPSAGVAKDFHCYASGSPVDLLHLIGSWRRRRRACDSFTFRLVHA